MHTKVIPLFFALHNVQVTANVVHLRIDAYICKCDVSAKGHAPRTIKRAALTLSADDICTCHIGVSLLTVLS